MRRQCSKQYRRHGALLFNVCAATTIATIATIAATATATATATDATATATATAATGATSNGTLESETHPHLDFSWKNLLPVWGGQSLFAVAAAVCIRVFDPWLKQPNWGFGANVAWPMSTEVIGFSLAATLALLVVNSALEKAVPERWATKEYVQSFVLLLFGPDRRTVPVAIAALVTGFAAGLGEEWFFRGLIQGSLSSMTPLGPWGGLAAASVIFGCGHLLNRFYFAVATMSGAFFGLLYMQVEYMQVVTDRASRVPTRLCSCARACSSTRCACGVAF